MRGAVGELADRARAGDVVAVMSRWSDGTAAVVRYYKRGAPVRVRPFPRFPVPPTPEDVRAAFMEAAGGHERMWVLISRPRNFPVFRRFLPRALGGAYRLACRSRYREVELFLFERAGS